MKTVMADKVFLKMHCYFLLVLLMINKLYCSSVDGKKEESCCCYDLCDKNFTSSTEKDVQKITACQRGCRFYSLVLHVSHELNPTMDYAHAKEGCLISCRESYNNLNEISACNFGCSSVKSTKNLCDTTEYQLPQITYSVLIEESDVLIHPGDSDPDDVLTDPGLRKQFEKTIEALLDSKPKLPEIHFRNLPITNEKPPQEHSHVNFKCPKFYGFDPKLEFRNGKIIIGDLYLFVGVFVFVVLCFLIGHHVETRNMTKQLMENRVMKTKDDYNDSEPLLKIDIVDKEYEEKEDETENVQNNDFEPNSNASENIDSKFEGITLVFHDDVQFKNNRNHDNSIKM